MNLIFTSHAINRLHNRGVTQADAWYTFQHPDGQRPGSTSGSTKFYKNYGQQRVEVVAKKNDRDEWVVLTCWARQQGNGVSYFKLSRANAETSFLEKLTMKCLAKLQKLFKGKP